MNLSDWAIRSLRNLADADLRELDNDHADQVVEEVLERVAEYDEWAETNHEPDVYSAVFKNSGADRKAELRAIADRIEKEKEES